MDIGELFHQTRNLPEPTKMSLELRRRARAKEVAGVEPNSSPAAAAVTTATPKSVALKLRAAQTVATGDVTGAVKERQSATLSSATLSSATPRPQTSCLSAARRRSGLSATSSNSGIRKKSKASLFGS